MQNNTLQHFFFYQKTPKSLWISAPASERDSIIAEHKPPFVSVLDVDNNFATDPSAEEKDALRYSGPFYADFDGSDGLDEVTQQFQKFLGMLQDRALDLDQCKLFATGGRGFHVEVPMTCFMQDIPPEGIERLPAIYGEIADSLFVDTLDRRVYTAGRGRLWRTPNVQRENGQYKVRITTEEALAMTPEIYSELCRTPRYLAPPAPPTFNPVLANLFTQGRDKVATKSKTLATKKRKAGPVAAKMKQRCDAVGYPMPPSLIALCTGQMPAREGVGFNQIILQLAISAAAMGLPEDELISLSSALIEGHHGDGERYNSPRKRERELRSMFRYVERGHYDLSIGGIRSILPKSAPCADLRGF